MILGILSLIVGSIVLAIGLGLAKTRFSWLRTTAKTTGIATQLEDISWAIRYEVNQKTYQLRTPNTLREGQEYSVRYALETPGTALIDSAFALWLSPSIFLLIGTLLIIWGLQGI